MKKILLLFSTVVITGVGFCQTTVNNIANALPLSRTGYDKSYYASTLLLPNRNVLRNSTTYNTAPNSGSTYSINYVGFDLETDENKSEYQPMAPKIFQKSGWYQFTTAPAYNFRYRIYDISGTGLTNTAAIVSLYRRNAPPATITSENSMFWYSGQTPTQKYVRICSSINGNKIACNADPNHTGDFITSSPSPFNFLPAPLSYRSGPTSAILYSSTNLPNLDPIAGSGINVADAKLNHNCGEYMELYDLQPNTDYFVQVLIPDCGFTPDTPKVSLTIIADILENDGSKQLARANVTFCRDGLSIPGNSFIGVETEITRAIDQNNNTIIPDVRKPDNGYFYETSYDNSIPMIGTGGSHFGSANWQNLNSPYGNNNPDPGFPNTGNWYFGATSLNARHHCNFQQYNNHFYDVYFQYIFADANTPSNVFKSAYYSFADTIGLPPQTVAELGSNDCIPQHSTRKTGSVSDIETTILNGKINVFPNPAQSKLSVTLSDMKTTNDLQFFVYDVNGKVVASDKLNVDQHAFDVNTQSLAKGVYVLKVVSDGKESQTANFVKE